VITTHAPEVQEIIECFEADWARKPFAVKSESRLIWCSGNGRERIAHFIDEAKHTLFVQNERYQDPVIIERLGRKKRRPTTRNKAARHARPERRVLIVYPRILRGPTSQTCLSSLCAKASLTYLSLGRSSLRLAACIIR